MDDFPSIADMVHLRLYRDDSLYHGEISPHVDGLAWRVARYGKIETIVQTFKGLDEIPLSSLHILVEESFWSKDPTIFRGETKSKIKWEADQVMYLFVLYGKSRNLFIYVTGCEETESDQPHVFKQITDQTHIEKAQEG